MLGTAALLVVFARPAVRESERWRATVTPLASIIGSGFLVVAPLLGVAVGRWAVVAIAGIALVAYLVGGAVRYNIRRVEDIAEAHDPRGTVETSLKWMERVAKVALALAYVIAVTFYLELLGAFALRLFDVDREVLQKAIATVLLVFIGGFGVWKGLSLLEALEQYAVELKLSIIGGLLIGLAVHNVELVRAGEWSLPALGTEWNTRSVRQLLGAFLIVQGFETSRYLRGAYEAEERIRTMRYAQWASGGIYIAFVALATVLLGAFDGVSETGIITLSERVAVSLPVLLVIAATGSQFSAAVADTIGAGGLVEEATHGRIPGRLTYGAVAALALALLWTTDILSVIAYASRAFAFYYAIQCAMAALHAHAHDEGGGRAHVLLYAFLAVVMALTTIFGIPAESAGSGTGAG